jgi:hypothetical protein
VNAILSGNLSADFSKKSNTFVVIDSPEFLVNKFFNYRIEQIINKSVFDE